MERRLIKAHSTVVNVERYRAASAIREATESASFRDSRAHCEQLTGIVGKTKPKALTQKALPCKALLKLTLPKANGSESSRASRTGSLLLSFCFGFETSSSFIAFLSG